MYFKELMSQEEKRHAKAIFLKTLKGNFIFGLFRDVIYLGLLIFSLKLISSARYTHSRLSFMLGWGILPLPIWYHFANSRADKRIKPLKKLKKQDKQFSDALTEEIVIDDEKITVNESLSILHKDVKTALFTKGFAAVTDGKKQPVIIKLSDEAQIRLYYMYSDRKAFRKKKAIFVVQEIAKKEYYIPEIEEKRKKNNKKRERKVIGIALVLGLISLSLSALYVKDHLMTEEEANPVFEHTYTEGENLHDMLENSFDMGSSMEAVFDVYLDYADKTFDSYVKCTQRINGVKKLTVCVALEDDGVYLREFTDDSNRKKRDVVCGQFTDEKQIVRDMFEVEYVQEKYPLIVKYAFIVDNWNFTLKDDSLFSTKGKGLYRFTENRAVFEEKGEEKFTVFLESGGENALPQIEKLFENLKEECQKPYDENPVSFNKLETDILYNLRTGD